MTLRNYHIAPFAAVIPGSRRFHSALKVILVWLGFLPFFSGMANASPKGPSPVSAGPYTIVYTYINNNAVADGVTNDVIQVTVLDASNNPVNGVTISFTIAGTTVSSNLTTGSGTFAAGTVQFGLASTTVNSTQILIQVNVAPVAPGSTANNIVTFTYLPGPPDPNPPPGSPNPSFYIVTQDNVAADGVSQDFVMVHLTDSRGNRLGAGIPVTFTILGGSAAGTAKLNGTTFNTITMTTNGVGEITMPITNTVIGDVVIDASVIVGGLPISISGSPRTVHFIVGTPVASTPVAGGTSYITTQDGAVADGTSQDIVKAHITDAGAHPVAGVPVTFTISGGAAGANAQLNGTTPTTITLTTDINGDIIMPITDITAGDVIIDATILVGGVATPINGSAQTVHFIAGAPVASTPAAGGTSYITTQSPEPADGTSQDMVKAHISDINGNSVPGVQVTFTVTGGSAGSSALLNGTTPTTITLTTDANGDIILPITNIKAGDVTISATILIGGIATPINGSAQTVQFVASTPDPNPPPGVPGRTDFITVTDGAVADGSSQDVVKAHLSDQNGNAVAGYPITFTITGGTAAANGMLNGTTPTTITLTTDINGDIVMPVTDVTAGDVVISATIVIGGVTFPISGSSQDIHFIAGPPSPTAPNAPPGMGTMLSVTQDFAVADNIHVDSVKAHITDAFGNAVGAGVMVTFSIQAGGTATSGAQFVGTVTLPTDANGNIEIAIINTVAGTVFINGALNGTNLISGSYQTIHFVAGVPVPSAPLAPPGTGTQLTITQDNSPADGVKVDSVKAHITDAYGNPVANVAVTFTIIAGGSATAGAGFQPGNVITITLTTDANGNIEAPITDIQGGDVWVNGSIIDPSNNVALIDGSHQVAHFTNVPDVNNAETQLIVVVYEALADGQSTTTVKAHVVDHNGNVLPGWDVTFQIDSGSATIVTPQPVTTDANGDAFINLTSKTPGYVLITATVNGQAIKFGSPARVKFAPINIYVPRVFTPNGDGTNDLLKPILVGIANFHYWSIYNRWGNLIYTSQDPNAGWDGTFKGVAQPVETYLWIAEGVDVSGKKIVQKGMVTLVR
jgi:adhesin/invasin